MSVSSDTASDGTVMLEAPKLQTTEPVAFTITVTNIVCEGYTFAPTTTDTQTITVTP